MERRESTGGLLKTRCPLRTDTRVSFSPGINTSSSLQVSMPKRTAMSVIVHTLASKSKSTLKTLRRARAWRRAEEPCYRLDNLVG
jgi:hypothetical protein